MYEGISLDAHIYKYIYIYMYIYIYIYVYIHEMLFNITAAGPREYPSGLTSGTPPFPFGDNPGLRFF
jgi:hypothetical protein